MNEPTKEDMARSLEADLRFVEQIRRHQGSDRSDLDAEFWAIGDAAWPAAIRRALAAEAEVERLRKQVEGHAERIAAQSELLSRRAEGHP